MQEKNTNFFITTPLYYVNDKPHLGHFYTTVLGDVLARYKKEQGFNTFFSTGVDEHGNKIDNAAKKAGQSPQAFSDKISSQFIDIWQRLNINYSDFIRTTGDKHKKSVFYFLKQLKNKDYLYEGIYKGLYCEGCETFIQETELDEKGFCPNHNKKPENIKEKNWFFKLSVFQEKLILLIKNNKLKIEPDARKKEVLGFLKQGLKDISISRESVKWGIPLPWDKSQITYVWIEALINYLTALDYPWEKKIQISNYKLQKYWPADIHLIAKDILKFHAIIWPAMLLAIGLDLPKKIFAHGFFTINGQKMSKTLGNVITPEELIDKFGVDGARYVVLAEITADKDTDVSWGKLENRYNSDLKNNIGNSFSRIIVLAQKNNIKEFSCFVSKNIKATINKITKNFNTQIDNINISLAIQETQKLVNFLNSYLDKTKPWQEKDIEKNKETLTNSFNILFHTAELLKAIMPEKTKMILKIKKGDKLIVPEKNIHLF